MKTPAVKAFKATYQGRYTLRDSDGDALSMTAMEKVADLLLEIMEVQTCYSLLPPARVEPYQIPQCGSTNFTLGARDFSSAVSGFCQVFIVTLGLWQAPKLPAAREKNLWYPGYTNLDKRF